ncbi:MAG: hypothetical protein AAGB04_27685, partial [Pseudomonadota bacterium]
MLSRSVIISLCCLAAICGSASAPILAAETHVVEMLNKHPTDKKKRNVYYPAVVYAKPGDTIKFVSKDKGHNAETIKGMLPKG